MSSEGYGQISGPSSSNAGQKKKKLAIISCSAAILLCMVVGAVVGISHHSSSKDDDSSGNDGFTTTSKAIKSICQPTDYKEICESSLSETAGNTSDPKVLVEAVFNISINYIREAFNHSSVLQAATKDPRTSDALADCKELLDYAINELTNSFTKFGQLDLSKIDDIVDDLKVWLSAAVTYQETCLDGFENTTGDAAESMRKALNSSQALTSNALAIIDEISSVLTTFQIPFLTRRLFSNEEADDGGDDDQYPSWVTNGKRRLLTLATNQTKPHVVVAQDGSGNYKTIKEALAAIPKNSNSIFVIYIKAGVYKEQVWLDKTMMNVMMIGDGPTKTRITGNLNFIDGTTTFRTATFAVMGDGFIAKNLGFENTAGPEKHQAVALRVQSDRSIFYNCEMDGFQDTLYCHTKRQFYRDCTITGTIDFIFGDSASIFQNCLIKVRKPLENQQCIVTASGRNDRREATAIILHNCTINADAAYLPFHARNPSYLGRPWKPFSRTLVMQSQIDDFIHPQGWLPWNGDIGLNTCFYAEVDNRGPGSTTSNRVTWRGYKKIDYSHAQKFTVEQFIQGNSWLKPTGVPYIPGLLPATEAGRVH